MILLQKNVKKVAFRKACLGERSKGLSSLGCWLRHLNSVVEEVAVVC